MPGVPLGVEPQSSTIRRGRRDAAPGFHTPRCRRRDAGVEINAVVQPRMLPSCHKHGREGSFYATTPIVITDTSAHTVYMYVAWRRGLEQTPAATTRLSHRSSALVRIARSRTRAPQPHPDATPY